MIPALGKKPTAGGADAVVTSRRNHNWDSGWQFAVSRIVRGYIVVC